MQNIYKFLTLSVPEVRSLTALVTMWFVMIEIAFLVLDSAPRLLTLLWNLPMPTGEYEITKYNNRK